MHAKWPYKICICSCILGELESFRNCKGYSVIIPKILDAIYRIAKVKIFLIPLSITFLSPKILGFLFVGHLLDKLRKLYMNITVIREFLAVLK